MVQKLLNSINSLLITNPTNIRYVTGFEGSAPEEREAYVLLTKKQTFLFTNSLYREKTKTLKGVTVVEISREEPFARKLAEALTGPGPVNRLGFEENNLTVAEYHKIMEVHKNVMLVPTQGRVEELRMIKREDEIENIRKAAKITDECFEFILKKIKPGINESEIAWEIEAFIRARSAQLAFSPIVAFGKNTSQPHYKTSDVGLRTSDIILVDFGARVNGYCSDMTRTVFVGKPEDEWKRAYETVLTAQQKALGYLTGPGPVTSRADKIARKVIQNTGFPTYPHSHGHGVGLDIHEAPRLTVKKDQILKPNMVITVEPGIYIEGQYGVRLEDLILLKEDGIEIVSKSNKEMIIL
ncbi:MAG: Xaa-Pro peptidase family protein [Patescibacteria group bacterium]